MEHRAGEHDPTAHNAYNIHGADRDPVNDAENLTTPEATFSFNNTNAPVFDPNEITIAAIEGVRARRAGRVNPPMPESGRIEPWYNYDQAHMDARERVFSALYDLFQRHKGSIELGGEYDRIELSIFYDNVTQSHVISRYHTWFEYEVAATGTLLYVNIPIEIWRLLGDGTIEYPLIDIEGTKAEFLVPPRNDQEATQYLLEDMDQIVQALSMRDM